MTTNEQIISLRKQHSLSQSQLAKLLHCSKSTVISWHRKATDAAYNKCPQHRLELLKLLLKNTET